MICVLSMLFIRKRDGGRRLGAAAPESGLRRWTARGERGDQAVCVDHEAIICV